MIAQENKPWVVLVAGSRDLSWDQVKPVASYLEPFSKVPYSIVLHGGGPPGQRPNAVGCDRITDTVARALKMRVFAAIPLWDQQSRAAGPIRNTLLLNILASHQQAGYRLAAGFFSTGGAGTEGILKSARSMSTVDIQVSEFPIQLE